MRKSFLLLPALMAVVLGCGDGKGTADAPAPAKEYTLRLKPTTAPVNYDVEVELTADVSQAPNVTEDMKKEEQKAKIIGKATLTVKDAGEGKLESTLDIHDVTVGEATSFFQIFGPIIAGSLQQETKTVTTTTGLLVGDDKKPSPFGINLPDKPVKVGDTWEGTRQDAEGKEVKVTGKVAGTEMVGGKECLRLELTGLSLSNQLPTSKPTIIVFDPEGGIAQKVTMELDINQEGLKGTGVVTMTRAK